MMKRLTGLDGVSLHGETAVMPTHVMAVFFCEAEVRGELTAGAIARLLVERTAATPVFRQRLLAKPLGLGQPVWVDDPDFHAGDHVHRLWLRKPGTLRELAALVGDLHEQRLDRNHPLWQAWVVQGLNDGRLAVVLKFSHAMSDGVGAVTSILPELMTSDPDHQFPAPVLRTPAAGPGVSELMGDLIDEIAANTTAGARLALRVAPRVAQNAAGSVRALMRRLLPTSSPSGAEVPEGDQGTPRTRLNAPITARRSVAFAAVGMDDLRIIADAYGVTVNDVFLTATTSALRRWLHRYDSVPDRPLRTFMPISTRGAEDTGSNRWSPAVVTLPVHLADPVHQLTAIHAATARVKHRRREARPVDLAEVIDLVPPVVVGMAAGLYTGLKLSRWHPPLAHLITSNVPGPRTAIYCAGARVRGVYPLAPLCDGSNLNVTAVSYGGRFTIGLVACPDNVEDVGSVARGIEDVVAELRDAAREKAGSNSGVVRSGRLARPLSEPA
ncbi:MAG: wax ester/triacylglycerol synthase family O-acyltransferase [Mycobacterium sp.]|nr:wax ester/triacylglycerol synthase family O-acyltransferase [Mycobacterium sp.]